MWVGVEVLALMGLDLVRVVRQVVDLAGARVDVVRTLVNHVVELVCLHIHAAHPVVEAVHAYVVDEIHFVVVNGIHVVEMGLVVLRALLGDSLVALSDIGVIGHLLLPGLRVRGVVLLHGSLHGDVIRGLIVAGTLTIILNDLSTVLSFVLFELLRLLLILLHELLLILLPLLGLQSVLLSHLLIKLVEVTAAESAISGRIFVAELGLGRADHGCDNAEKHEAAGKSRFHGRSPEGI